MKYQSLDLCSLIFGRCCPPVTTRECMVRLRLLDARPVQTGPLQFSISPHSATGITRSYRNHALNRRGALVKVEPRVRHDILAVGPSVHDPLIRSSRADRYLPRMPPAADRTHHGC
jgi:hypothetical protein